MRNVIYDSVVLPAASESLFQMYLDAEQHAALTGKPVVIGPESGAEFQAFEGLLSGRILQVVAPRMIVQSWRSASFRPEDADSTLILTFTSQGDEGRIDLVHLDVPDHDIDGVTQGWKKFYWTPWREYLAKGLFSP